MRVLKMSRLSAIRKSLQDNPEVVIVNIEQYGNINKVLGYTGNDVLTHEVKLTVAPRTGLYTAKELQGFMNGLILNIPGKIYASGEFREPLNPVGEYSDFGFSLKNQNLGYLHLGYVQYAERVGSEQRTVEVKRIINIAVNDLVDNSGLINNPRVERKTQETFQQDYLRRIWISPFPNREIAENALSHPDDTGLQLYASLDQIMPYRKDLRDLADKIKK